MNEETVACLL